MKNLPEGAMPFKEERAMDKIINRESKEYRNAWLKELQGVALTETEKRDLHTSSNFFWRSNNQPKQAKHYLTKMVTLAPMLSKSHC